MQKLQQILLHNDNTDAQSSSETDSSNSMLTSYVASVARHETDSCGEKEESKQSESNSQSPKKSLRKKKKNYEKREKKKDFNE